MDFTTLVGLDDTVHEVTELDAAAAFVLATRDQARSNIKGGEHPLPGSASSSDAREGHQEFLRFLDQIERKVPTGKKIHVMLDNYGTHKHANTRAWLARHPRWTCHFIPTSSSWLNAVEGFFAKLTRRRLKHGVFKSVEDLKAAIDCFITEHNQTEAKPFIWKADPDEIIAARNRGFQVLESIH